MKNLTILAVNDVPDQLELLVFILGQAGYRVLSAADGVEGFETARRESPDLIISDVAMPEMNGIDFCRAVRADERLSATPFLLVSTLHKDTEYAVKGLEAGADDYVESPFEPMRLVAKAARLVERKTVLEAYRDSERRYRNFIEQSAEGIWRVEFKEPISIDLPVERRAEIARLHGFYAECNDAMARMYGLESAKDLTGRYVSEFLAPAVKADGKFVRAFMENGYRLNDCETHERDADGNDKYFLNNFVGMVADGNLVSVWGIQRDITGQRKIERALRESQTHLALAQQASKTGSFELNLKTGAAKASREMKYLYGLPSAGSAGELENWGENWSRFVHPEDAPKVERKLAEALESGVLDSEYRIARDDDGSIRWIHASGQVFYDQNEAPECVIGVNTDITERKESETELRASRESLEIAQKAAKIGSFEFDFKTRHITSSSSMEILYGLPPGSLTGPVENWSKYVHPEDLPRIRQQLNQIKSDDEYKSEFRVLLADGSTRWIVSKGRIFYDEQKKPSRLVGVNIDITERKKAEESNRFQAHLLDTVEQAVIATDKEGIVVYWNRFAEKLYGWASAEAVGRSIMELTPTEMSSGQAAKIMTQLNEGKSWAGEFTVRNKTGATFPAHVSNSPVSDANGELIGIVGVSVDITERKRAEAALRQAEIRYRNLVELSPAIVYLAQPSAPYSTIYISPNVRMFGYEADEWLNRDDMWFSLLHEEDRSRVLENAEKAVGQGLGTEQEYRIVARGGEVFWVHDKGCFIFDDEGNKTGWQGVILDITENKKLEEQLRQSQKLESVGRMAGGIAHDFNNMLTAINGYSDLTLRRLPSEDPLRGNIEEIKKAGERSAQLTQQLLAFSRRQVLKPKILNLNEVILETSKLLERLIGEDIQLSIVPFSGLGLIEADPGQLTQVIINLAINARDAMPRGGNLAIETSNVWLDKEFAAAHVPTQAGSYVLLTVGDSGVGMSEEVERHIFEPFYTTKETGKGTGLGLSTVYGIVKQSEGYIWVKSEEGAGTTFEIYLPRVDVEADSELSAQIKTPEIIEGGKETILLVEDEDIVRNMSRRMLEACGYTVVEAADGLEALALCAAENRKIDLLLTDVVMPQMGGRELAEKLARKYPHIRLLYTSGYTDDAVIRQDIMTEDMNFIQKPFDFDTLAKKIRELLDAKK